MTLLKFCVGSMTQLDNLKSFFENDYCFLSSNNMPDKMAAAFYRTSLIKWMSTRVLKLCFEE